MVRLGLRNCDVSYEARCGNRKRAEYSGEELKLKISDNIRLMRNISKSENVDEDYVELLKLVYNYDKKSQSYTNEHGNDGSYDEVEVEVEDEDEADPQYKMFLANAKPDRRSYVLNIDTEDGFHVFVKYEKECECNYGCECLCWKKQKDIEMQKDALDEENLLNKSNIDEVKSRKSPMTDLGYNSNRPMGDVDVIFEPSNPNSQRENGTMSRKLSTGKHGASKRQGKCETQIKSGEEQMMEKGSNPGHVSGNEKASDVDEDWGMKASLRSGCSIEYEAAEDELEILYDNSDMFKKISVQSEFRQKVMDLLKKPYNPKEYKELWTYVSDQKPVERNMELRRGGVKSYKTNKMGKSYLDHYEDLKEKLEEVDNDKRKKLKILRAFFFWLQNLTHGGAFKPWNDTEFLEVVAESS